MIKLINPAIGLKTCLNEVYIFRHYIDYLKYFYLKEYSIDAV